MLNYMSLKDYVYQYISKEIKNGNLKPNDKINEQRISDELNISRTPVREALIQLAAEGLLDNQPRRGFRVKPLSLEEAKNLYALIGHLDSMAASLAIEKLDYNDINEMKKLSIAMDKAINNAAYDEYYQLQLQFHNVYIKKCGNNELINIMNQLKLRFIRQGYFHEENEELMKTFKDTNEEHKTIIRLFESKETKKLENFLKEVHWNVDHASLDVL